MSNFTNFAETKDAVAFKEALQTVIASKVADALANYKADVASRMFDDSVNEEVERVEEAGGKLPAGVKVKKTPGHPGDDESEHTVTHNGKELGHITKSWDGNHSAVHYSAGPHHSEVDQTDHDDHHSAVKAILKTHGLSEDVKNVEEEKIEMTRGGRATGNAIKDIVAKNNARLAKKKADAAKAEKG